LSRFDLGIKIEKGDTWLFKWKTALSSELNLSWDQSTPRENNNNCLIKNS